MGPRAEQMVRPELYALRVALGGQGTVTGDHECREVVRVALGFCLGIIQHHEELTRLAFASLLHSHSKDQVVQTQFLGDKNQSASLPWIREHFSNVRVHLIITSFYDPKYILPASFTNFRRYFI